MSHEDQVRLQHMLDAARAAIEFTRGKTRSDLEDDQILALGVVRLLEIVGEAAKQITQSFKDTHPQVAWREIGSTRDRLIHGYFDIDFDIIWTILAQDLPRLVEELEKILADGGTGDAS